MKALFLKRSVVFTSLGGILFSSTSCGKSKKSNLYETRFLHIQKDKEKLLHAPPIPSHPLSLGEILECVLSKNLELLVQNELLFINEKMSMTDRLRMMPSLSFNSENKWRNKYRGDVGRNQFNPKNDHRNNIGVSADILEMALAHSQYQKAKINEQIVQQRVARLKQNLIQRTISAYLRAYVMQKSALECSDLIRELAKARKDWAKQREIGNVDNMVALEAEKQLFDAEGRLHSFTKEAKILKRGELPTLMGLPPGVELELAPLDESLFQLLELDIKVLEEKALVHRPELYINDLEEQIAQEQVRRAFIDMLPGVSLGNTYNYDSNKNYTNNNWHELTFRVVYDLFSIPSKCKKREVAKQEARKAEKARETQTIAVLLQVHRAFGEYNESKKLYELSQKQEEIAEKQLALAEKLRDKGERSETEYLEKRGDAFKAKINSFFSFADLMSTLSDVNHAIGIPFFKGFAIELPKQEKLQEIVLMHRLVEEKQRAFEEKQREETKPKVLVQKSRKMRSKKTQESRKAPLQDVKKKKRELEEEERLGIKKAREKHILFRKQLKEERKKWSKLVPKERRKRAREWKEKEHKMRAEEAREIHLAREKKKREWWEWRKRENAAR